MARATTRAWGEAKATIDHDEIRRWVEERGGKPAVVKGTATGRQPGILRIDFPGFSGEESLEKLGWDDWFERFDAAKLAFLYQGGTKSGRANRFSKLVSLESVEMGDGKASALPSSSARSGRGRRVGTRATPRKNAPRKKATPPRSRASSRTQSAAKRESAGSQRATPRGSSPTQRAAKRGGKGKSRVKRRAEKSR
jgi:hypothetical protein